MSLKARFRLAIVTLTVAIVILLSLLYVRDFLEASFRRTAEVAESITGNVQASTTERLTEYIRSLPDPPKTAEQATPYWLEAVQHDPGIQEVLKRASANWHQIAEVFIADLDGRIRASSMPEEVGHLAPPAVNFEQWKEQHFLVNLRQVLVTRENTEYVRALGSQGKPVFTIHVVISSVFLKNELLPRLTNLGVVFLIALLISVALGLALPTLVLSPLERLSQRIDLIAAGGPAPPLPPRGEAKEFAAVHSKLNLLGQQFEGARQDASALRSNVEQLIEQLQEAVLIFDTSGRLMMAGEPSRRFVGSNPEKLIGKFLRDIFPPVSGMGALLRQCLEKREPVRDRLVTLNVGGIEQQVIASVEPLFRPAPSGSPADMVQPLGILVALRDAGTRGQLEEQLNVADRLTAMSQLTRGVAHEIKNPLNAITLHLEVLKNRLGPDEVPEVGVIAREITRLNRIVKTFLDFHRPVDVRLRRMDLNELVCDVARLVEPDASSHGVQVQCSPAPEPAWIEADRDLLQQAMLNVVMNALEAMPDGGDLFISCSHANDTWRVAVSDSGPGIPQEIRDKIFNLYFTTKENGSGMGLAMAYRFVQLLNGRLSITSEPGDRTTFLFELPEALFEPWTPTSALSQGHRA